MSSVDITAYKSTLPYSKHDLGTKEVSSCNDQIPWEPQIEMEHSITLVCNQKEYPYNENYAGLLGLDPEEIDHKDVTPELYRYLVLLSPALTLQTIPGFVNSAIRIHCDNAIKHVLDYAEQNPEPEILSGLCSATNGFDEHTDDSKMSEMQRSFKNRLNQIILKTSIFTIEARNSGHLTVDYFKYALTIPNLVVKSEFDLISCFVTLAKGFITDEQLEDYAQTLDMAEAASGDDAATLADIRRRKANPAFYLLDGKLDDFKTHFKFDQAQGVYNFEATEYYKKNSKSTSSVPHVYAGFKDSEIDDQIKPLVRIDDFTITVMFENYEKNLAHYKAFLDVVRRNAEHVPYELRLEFHHLRHADIKTIAEILGFISSIDLVVTLCFDYRAPQAFNTAPESPNNYPIEPPTLEDVKDIVAIAKSPKCLVELDLRGFDLTNDVISKEMTQCITGLPNLDILELAHYKIKKGFEFTFLSVAVQAKLKDVRLLYPKYK